MDLLRGSVKKIYFQYLRAAFGSALISSIYGIVDMAAVGRYQGPQGTAALAVVAPVWNIIFSLGLLTGIGGSVLYGAARGGGDPRRPNEYFTAALWGAMAFALLSWAALLFWQDEMLAFFGGGGDLLPLARAYLAPIRPVAPLFLLNQMLAAFLRNDGDPALATRAVLGGGVFNIFGDWFFVFEMGLGVWGAGLATALGALITFAVMLTHFASPRNTLRPVRTGGLFRKLGQVLAAGFSAFFVDVAMGILTVLFNRQIMRYGGADALSVYGVLVNVSTIVQCCAYSVGQAAQPILSRNYGAGQWGRIGQTLRWALFSAAFFGLAWTGAVLLFPGGIIRLFMSPTGQILQIAPFILRAYGLSFLLLPLNIFSTYYFQALMKPLAAFWVSVGRGLVVSGALILALPFFLGPLSLWFAMPATEAVTAAMVLYLIRKYTKEMSKEVSP